MHKNDCKSNKKSRQKKILNILQAKHTDTYIVMSNLLVYTSFKSPIKIDLNHRPAGHTNIHQHYHSFVSTLSVIHVLHIYCSCRFLISFYSCSFYSRKKPDKSRHATKKQPIRNHHTHTRTHTSHKNKSARIKKTDNFFCCTWQFFPYLVRKRSKNELMPHTDYTKKWFLLNRE